MRPMFESLLELMKEPFHPERGVRTDSSILLVYPPEKELDFREQLVDVCFPALEAQGTRFHALDLTDFLFEDLSGDAIEALQEEEFDDYEWMLHGLASTRKSRCERAWRRWQHGIRAATLSSMALSRSTLWSDSAKSCAACATFTLGSRWRFPARNAAASSNS